MNNSDLGFRKKVKLSIKNRAFRTAHKSAIRRLKRIASNSAVKPVKRKNSKKILFNLVYGMYGRLIYWECGLAKALQLRGHDVKVLTCGKSLTMCTSEYTIQTVHDDKTCQHCIDFSRDFLNVVGLPFFSYEKYISKEEIENIKQRVEKLSKKDCESLVYKGVGVGPLSINATVRYFEGDINPDKDKYETILREELTNSIIATDVAEKIVKEDKPDVVVTTHLGYSSWGALVDYCANKGIRICYPGDGYIENTVEFDFDITGKPEEFFKKFYEEHRKKKPLNGAEDKELQKFIDNRIHGREGDTAVYGYGTQDVKDQFNLDKYEKTFACFPNVAWDSSLLNADISFKNVYEWILKTVELFKDKPNHQLIVKIHPSEAYVAKSKNTVSDFIRSKFDPLPDNIKIIPPVTNISPYSLFEFIDAGIVYNGTIGLEMALQGIPVVVAGITHYGKKGFTYDVRSREDYDKILFKKLLPPTKQEIQLARVYAYFYFLKSFVTYDLVYNKSFLKLGWNISSFDELAEGNNKFLDIICNYIANNGLYQNW